MDATALIIQLVFTFIFAAALVGWFTWPASRANWPVEVVQWAQGHALQLTPAEPGDGRRTTCGCPSRCGSSAASVVS